MGAVARLVTVHGRVHGVYFRDSCTREARSRAVTGWVRNDEAGSVTAHFEGTPHDVEAMVTWCRSGPPRAEVEDLDVRDVDPEDLTSFEVR